MTTVAAGLGVQVDSSSQILRTDHQDYITHVSFDVYGRKMATCGGDRSVKVWELLQDGTWICCGEWQAHRSSINGLSWSHPEFGTLIATCGSDQDVKIWEETAGSVSIDTSSSSAHQSSSNSSKTSLWTQRAQLTEARRAVQCCSFGPRHLGLQLAVGSADGVVRIYEAVDVLNLSQWTQASIQAFGTQDPGVTTLSWCTSPFEPPTLVVGGSNVVILRYDHKTRPAQWQSLLSMQPQGPVSCVSWAPNVGRRFHWIAAVENQRLRVYRFPRKPGGNHELELESSQVLDDVSTVWKCQWNVTGTVLACGGDDGLVQLWKFDFSEKTWNCVSEVRGDLPMPSTIPMGGATAMMT